MNIFLIILLYCLIGAIIEFLLVFSVLVYTKRHSNSNQKFIEAWNKATDMLIVPSLFNPNNISKEVANIFNLQICTWTFVWPFHISAIILISITTYVFKIIDRFFDKLASVLLKR